MSTSLKVYPLKGVVQKYAWGHLGSNSEVARLIKGQEEVVDENTNYAELWLGTHVSGPALVGYPSSSNPSDIQWKPIKEHLEESLNEYKEGLPYLLKVLSIKTALSIQAHPDLILAKKLYAQFPHIYKDPNHKPEIAIPITLMDTLCGFRPISEIVEYLKTVPELFTVIGEPICQMFFDCTACFAEPPQQPYTLPNDIKSGLQNLFLHLMTASEQLVKDQLTILVNRLATTSFNNDPAWLQLSTIIQRLHHDTAGDVGVFCVFMLNLMHLQPGEALFLAPNEPHAYLHGNCVECMATSDNVVRAGLTPKFKDVNTLVPMLTYKCGMPKLYKGQERTQSEMVYAPPVPEFVVSRFSIDLHETTIPETKGPSIFLILSGTGEITYPTHYSLECGNSFFVHPQTAIKIKGTTPAAPILIFRATIP